MEENLTSVSTERHLTRKNRLRPNSTDIGSSNYRTGYHCVDSSAFSDARLCADVPARKRQKRSHQFKLSRTKVEFISTPFPSYSYFDCRIFGGINAHHEFKDSSLLIYLLRQERWYDAMFRLKSHPLECTPTLIREQGALNTHRISRNDSWDNDSIGLVGDTFDDTCLGVACRASSRNTLAACSPQFKVIEELCRVCPQQIRCDQRKKGHTPLLDAICNSTFEVEKVKLLIFVDCSMGIDQSSALLRQDGNGMSPLDHLLIYALRCTNSCPVDAIKFMLTHCPEVVQFSRSSRASPLVRLLTNAMNLLPNEKTTKDASIDSNEVVRGRIVECAAILLSVNPELIESRSIMTKCTPLHLALRCPCSNELVELFLEKDPFGRQLMTKNKFGDLPLHVAASIDTPDETMRLIIKRTLLVWKGVKKTDPIEGLNPLLWSPNAHGYTPMQLAWMRRIEEKRPYPLFRRGVVAAGRYVPSALLKDGLYSNSLENALEQVKNVFKDPWDFVSDFCGIIDCDRDQPARVLLGSFWEVVVALLEASRAREAIFAPEFSPRGLLSPNGMEGQKSRVLHAAAVLPSHGPGPYLPRSLFDTLLLVFPEQVYEQDEYGRTPLHYAAAARPCAACKSEQSTALGWEDCFSKARYSMVERESRETILGVLLHLNQRGASMADRSLRLPLHLAIESEKVCNDLAPPDGSIVYSEESHCHGMSWSSDVVRLALAYPEALDRRDPIHHLYPFMQAAVGPYASLNTVYNLLRISPSRVSSGSSVSQERKCAHNKVLEFSIRI